MDAGDLAVFAAVARAGGITKAARTLRTVQSNVTQRVRLLEAELGVPLFHRHSRGVTLPRIAVSACCNSERPSARYWAAYCCETFAAAIC